MKILSRNSKLVLGSTAIVVVLSSVSAFSADVSVENTAAYTFTGPGTQVLSGGTYNAGTTGASTNRAWGVLVHSDSTLNVSNIEVTTTGSKAHGIQVGQFGGDNFSGGDKSVINLSEGVGVKTAGADSFGLHAIDGGSITGAAKIVTIGTNGFGAFAESGSGIALTGADIKTSGQNAHGIIANNDKASAEAGKISAANSEIKTEGAYAAGAYADAGASVGLTGTKVETEGAWAHGVVATNNGKATVDGGSIKTKGDRAYGLLAANGGTVVAKNVDITTEGAVAHGVQAGGNGTNVANYDGSTKGTIELDGGKITVKAKDGTSWGTALHAVDQGVITANDVDIVSNSYGAIAESGSTINITGGSTVTTSGANTSALVANNDRKKNGNGAPAVGGQLNVSDTTVVTTGDWAHGVLAEYDAKATVERGSITTEGDRAYGLLATNGGVITATDVDITTKGAVAHSVQAGANGQVAGSTAGTVNLTGGSVTFAGSEWGTALHAVDSGVITANNVDIKSNSYGAIAESGSTIDVTGSRVTTTGKNTSALIANNDLRSVTGGALNVTDTIVTTSGANSHGVSAEYGGKVTAVGGSISTTGEGASAINVIGSSTVNVTGTTLSSANAATINVLLNASDDVADITFGSGTNATVNNGNLLLVNRTESGLSGDVNFVLEAGSVSTGNIVDDAENATGGTNLTVKTGASWTGKITGIKDVTTESGSTLNFDEATSIAGDVNAANTVISFSENGGSIGKDLTLTDGSSTSGGHNKPIIVVGDVSVETGSTLGGNWDIKQDLTVSGANIGPGNSIGTVTVGGNLTLDGESTYEVEVDKFGESDLIKVDGLATLAGTVSVSAYNGLKLGHAYTILTAANIDGTFATEIKKSEDLIFVDPELEYIVVEPPVGFAPLVAEESKVQLTFNRNDVAFSSVAQTGNQASTADSLDSLSDTSDLKSSIASLNASGARQAFEQLAGDNYASNKSGLIETSHLTADAINERLRGAFEGVAVTNVPVMSYAKTSKSSGAQAIDSATAAQASNTYAVWATGFGSWVDQSGNSNAGGLKTSVGGFMSGVDFGLESNWRLGVAGGYSKTDLDGKNRSSSATSDNWHLGVYGGNQWDALGLRLGLVQSWHSIDSSRSVAFNGFDDSLSADYNARSLHAFGEVGYRIDAASAAFEPFANLSHVRLRTNGFTEQGGNAALSVEKDTTNTTFTTLGLRASTSVALGTTNAKLNGTLGWRHAYGDITPTSMQAFAGSQAFSVDGVAIAKDVAVLGAGFEVDLTEISTLGINYSGQYGNGAKQNGFNATLNVKF